MAKAMNVKCENCTCVSRGIFCDLNQSMMDEVSRLKVMNSYKKGQTLFTEGSPNFGLYCINSGKIKVIKTAPDGKETILRIVGAGDILGHHNILTDEKNQVTATVIEEGSVCFLDRSFVHDLIAKQPSVAMNIIKKLSYEMMAAENRNANMNQMNVRERLADLLISLKTTYGVKEAHRTKLDIKLTREEMASIVGTANETIIRFITEFKEDGIIAQEGKVIYLLDEYKLNKTANARL